MPLFGQILAALYQDDIVEEDDIRNWHKTPSAEGEGAKPPASQENFKKCWVVGARMIKQFDEQESEEGSEDEAEDSEGDKNPAPAPQVPGPAKATPQASLEDDESEEEDDGDGDESEDEQDESK